MSAHTDTALALLCRLRNGAIYLPQQDADPLDLLALLDAGLIDIAHDWRVSITEMGRAVSAPPTQEDEE